MTTFLRTILLSLLVLSVPSAALAGDQMTKADIPAWFALDAVPEQKQDQVALNRGGVANLLLDDHIRHAPDGWEAVNRKVYRIVDRTGLDDGGRVTRNFNPATQDVALVRLRVIRDGIEHDRLKDARIEIVRQEREARKGILDGRLTAYVYVDDVRVGDVVDAAFQTRQRSIIAPDLIHFTMQVQWGVPVALNRMIIDWPEDRPLGISNDRTDIAVQRSTHAGLARHLWEVRDPQPAKAQENLPADYRPYPSISVSSARDWQDVVNAMRPHYPYDAPLPDAFAGKVDEIAAEFPRAADRLVEATRLVQDDIRYVSLAMGRGSYIPRLPAEVVASGFGDCKDKALILAIALRRLGIEADVALTDTERGAGLSSGLAGLARFDHVIVRARSGSSEYWLDATNFLQGGRADTLVPPGFGYALPLVADARLEPIPSRPQVTPEMMIEENFVFPATEGEPLRLTVDTTYRNQGADWMRYRLLNESAVRIAENYGEYYNRNYPGIASVEPMTVEDDRDANVLRLRERYEMSAGDLAADGIAKEFPLKSDVGIGDLPTPSRVGRTAPVWIGRPAYKEHRITVSNLKSHFRPPDDYEPVFTPFNMFTVTTSATATRFEAVWRLMTTYGRVPAENVAKYLQAVDKMQTHQSWTFDFTYVEGADDEP